jgi:hypothetical protein
MPCAHRGRRIFSAEPQELQGGVAAGLDGQEASCSERMDAGERCFGDGITRAEVMEYLSQTYGTVFVADLVKHLS